MRDNVRTPGYFSGVLALLLLTACSEEPEQASIQRSDSQSNYGPYTEATYISKPASAATLEALTAARQQLPKGDFLDGSNLSEHSEEQRIADLPEGVGPADFSEFDFVLADQPETVHPSLHAAVRKAFADRGLFKIAEEIYQVRGDIAHITFVRGETGWIVLDAGVSREFAAGAWALLRKHVPESDTEPVTAVVYSHSHGDHFGGVKGLITQAQVEAGEVEIIAPHGFMREVISESIIAGNAMMRRGGYHFGAVLAINNEGTGSVPIMTTGGGAMTLIVPTIELPEGQGKNSPAGWWMVLKSTSWTSAQQKLPLPPFSICPDGNYFSIPSWSHANSTTSIRCEERKAVMRLSGRSSSIGLSTCGAIKLII